LHENPPILGPAATVAGITVSNASAE
jgi:hypothetical protein